MTLDRQIAIGGNHPGRTTGRPRLNLVNVRDGDGADLEPSWQCQLLVLASWSALAAGEDVLGHQHVK